VTDEQTDDNRRTYVVTGSASGIGAATREQLCSEGHRVVGVDLRDAEITADLSSEAGRQEAVVGLCREFPAIDAVIACAGVDGPDAITIRVNYFGVVHLLEGLLPVLQRSLQPRVAVVSSVVSVLETDPTVVGACLADDEELAVSAAAVLYRRDQRRLVYSSCKNALSRWLRRTAPSRSWAGHGVTLNGVAPAVVETPMMKEVLSSAEGRERLANRAPMPIGGPAAPSDIADVLVWLTRPSNRFVTGQIIYVDGGGEAMWRGDAVF
jgi:NAD(P)-dependent dehydrogenase (short-subunit alcohol dehydrogenase family)